MQICNQVRNTLLDRADDFAENAALLRFVDLRLIGTGEIDIDDLLLRGFFEAERLGLLLNSGQIDLSLVFALQQKLLFL